MRSNATPLLHSRGLRYLAAIVLVLLVAVLRLALAGAMEDRAAFLLFVPAVAISAYLGGLGPGILATLLATICGDLLFLRRYYNWQPAAVDEALQIAAFVLAGTFISFLSEALHRHRHRGAELLAARLSAAEQMRRSEERYRTFVQQSTEGIWRFELDEPIALDQPEDLLIDLFYKFGYLAECNDAFARMYGYESAEQITGARLGDLLVRSDPRNVEFLRRFIRQKFRISEAESHERDKEGREKYFLNNFVGVVEGGQLLRVWGTQRDVTVEKRDQERLSLYREIIANSNDGIAMIDPRGHYIEQNAAHRQLVGFSDEELHGETPAIHLGKETFEKIAKELTRSGRWRGEAISHVKSGDEVPVDLSAFVVRDSSGLPLCYVGIKRDITQRKRAETRLTAEHAVTRILSEAASLDEAAPVILESLRETLHAKVGALWLPDAQTNVLRCTVTTAPAGEQRCWKFGQESRRFTFAPGIGLPGRVWKSRSPSWIVNVVQDPNFPRARFAADASLVSGMAFPIVSSNEVFGVIEFFTDHALQPDNDLLNMMSAIGSEIGQFIRRRRAEEQLRRSQEDLKDFVENATIGLHWVDPDGTIIWANKAERELLGYSPDEFIGRNIADFHVDREVIDKLLHRLSCAETICDYEARLRCKDGSIRHVLIDSNVMWEDGRLVHSRCFTRDITEQKKVERALRDSEQSLRLALEAGRMGTWEWEIKTGKVKWSQGLERLHGLLPGAFAGTLEAFMQDIDPEDRARVSQQIEETLKHRRDHHIEYRLRLPDGSMRWVEGRGKLWFDADGNPARMSGVCLDITKRKVAEEQRDEFLVRERGARAESERANRAKDEFLAVLSHELRTPLTPVLLTVSVLEKRAHLSPEVRADLQTIRRNVELEARLIDDLLDLTRISRGKLTLDLQPTDLHLLLRNAIEICSRGDQVRLVSDLRAARHTVRADPARLQQVFWNLLNNAHKFTPAGGTISVRTRNGADEKIIVEVSDTGVGIEPELQPKIFNAFEQGDDLAARRSGGLGLGLAISKALMRGQGGELSVFSEGKGKGSTFTVELPTIVPRASALVSSDAGDSNGRADPRALRILIVEDHQATREIMAKLLGDLGHRTATAAGIESALQAAKQQQFDLIISDLGLPDGSGHELMRQIRQRYTVRGIALSGYGMEEDVRRSSEAGFNEHLTKPIDINRLQAAIQRVTHPEFVG